MKRFVTSLILLLSLTFSSALRANASSQWMWHGAFPWVYSHAESSWWYMKAGTDGKFLAWKQGDEKWYSFDEVSKAWVVLPGQEDVQEDQQVPTANKAGDTYTIPLGFRLSEGQEGELNWQEYDDFSGSSLNAEKWGTMYLGGGIQPYVSNGKLVLRGGVGNPNATKVVKTGWENIIDGDDGGNAWVYAKDSDIYGIEAEFIIPINAAQSSGLAVGVASLSPLSYAGAELNADPSSTSQYSRGFGFYHQPASGGEVERFKIGQRGVPHRLSVTLTDGVIKMYVDDGLQYSSDAGNFNIDMFYVYAFNDHQESGIPFELNADNVRVLTSGQEEEQEEKQSTDVSLEMLWVEPGTFTMGSPTSENSHRSNETQHEVTLTNGFWLGKHEVTQAQWENVMGDNPSHFKGADRPVEIVSWDEVTSFCEKLTEMEREAGRLPAGMTYQLPTEAQWEYACRAGTTTAYAFGDSLTSDQANIYGGPGETTDVGKYPANAWGFHDMHGNVWEWTADWYEEFTTGAVSDPVGPAGGSLRVVRSGAWDNTANAARSAFRNRSVPASSLYILGFRLSLRPASQ